ncbi:MAG: hypothetical protein M1817_002955 [Caeruleum heppii]|nr:MAG: hypothetical protein M1817_002955 [Caeruleum heppii]
MSAPNAGRQSPEPARQSGSQQQDTPSTGDSKAGAAPSDTHAKESSDNTKFHGLESNPKGAMDDKADKATGKDGRGVDV